MIELTPGERRLLKAHAHKLRPVVMIGDNGLTEAVLRAIDASLKSHELIKIKVASDDRAARDAILAEICAAVDASPVQHIGKILVLYRENPTPPAPIRPANHGSEARTSTASGRPNTKGQKARTPQARRG